MQENKRILEVDALRGLAIVLMIIYHFIFDLNYFGLANFDMSNPLMIIFQRVIAVLFVGLVGVSLVLSENKNKNGYLKHMWRGFKLTNFAILITAVTWIYPHKGFISFGIIHMIALSTFIAPLFFRFKKWNLLIGIVLIVVGIWFNLHQTDSRSLFWLGLIYPEYEALDFYPILPWFGVVLTGMAICELIYKNKRFEFKNTWANRLAILGRHSLAIYLTHQIILVGIIMAYIISR
ncbi:MAG: heparan-alpha-glucosaminide N-acetyltransferase [Candidatus Micrarchaeota archaeon]